MKAKKAKKGKKAKVAVKDLEIKKVEGGVDPKGGFNPQPEPPAIMNKVQIPSVKSGFDPQPEPPGMGNRGGRIR